MGAATLGRVKKGSGYEKIQCKKGAFVKLNENYIESYCISTFGFFGNGVTFFLTALIVVRHLWFSGGLSSCRFFKPAALSIPWIPFQNDCAWQHETYRRT